MFWHALGWRANFCDRGRPQCGKFEDDDEDEDDYLMLQMAVDEAGDGQGVGFF